MTVTTKKAAAGLIREASISSVWAYTNLGHGMRGRTQYAAFTDEMYNDIYQAPNVCDPVCLKNEDGLTKAGEAFMLSAGLDEIEKEDLYPVSKEAQKFNEERGMGGWNE
jgi:hypothetical protein